MALVLVALFNSLVLVVALVGRGSSGLIVALVVL